MASLAEFIFLLIGMQNGFKLRYDVNNASSITQRSMERRLLHLSQVIKLKKDPTFLDRFPWKCIPFFEGIDKNECILYRVLIKTS